MAIPPRRPAWVVSELSQILGFDEETVKEAILPELESNTHEARLRSYLQDFLGPSPASKAFIAKYVSFRFPSIASTPTSLPRPSSPLSLRPTSKSRNRTQPSTPQIQPRPADIDSALSAAFGPGGQVYQKNRDADDTSGWASRSHSQNASGSRTPARQAGALSIHEKAKARVDDNGDRGNGKGKGKDKEKIWDLPKSIATKRLERIEERLKEVQAGEGKTSNDDTSVECFCQARVHTLSPYTPQCPHCGLALCHIHPAHRPCPSCHRPILNPAQLARLILRIQDEIAGQLAKEQSAREEVERQRLARQVAESGGGAFPTLSSGPSSSTTSTSNNGSNPNARKVLSIGNNKKGKSTITTTTYRTSPSQAATPIEPLTPPIPDDIVPAPRMMPLEPARAEKELSKALAWREAEDRPWGDKKRSPSAESGASVSSLSTSGIGIGAWEYVEEAVIGVLDEGHEGRRKAKKKGRGENGRIVPGAAT